MFRWADGTTDQQVQALREALGALPAAIPELRDYRVGPDAGLVEENWDFVVVADVDDAAAWRAYVGHPDHRKVITEFIGPMHTERAAIQFEC